MAVHYHQNWCHAETLEVIWECLAESIAAAASTAAAVPSLPLPPPAAADVTAVTPEDAVTAEGSAGEGAVPTATADYCDATTATSDATTTSTAPLDTATGFEAATRGGAGEETAAATDATAQPDPPQQLTLE